MHYKRLGNVGFTLVEIIVVLLILALLAAVGIPTMLGFVSNSKKTLCDDTRLDMQRLYQSSLTGTDNSKVSNSDFKLFVEKNWGTKSQCPAGGEYTYIATAEPGMKPNILVRCSKHSNTSSNSLYVTAINVKLWAKILSSAELQASFGVNSLNKLNNESYRAYLLRQQGGQWEALPQAIIQEFQNANNKKLLYVNAYVQPKGDVIIYANGNQNDTDTNLWAATAIYNPDNGYWYERFTGSYNLAYMYNYPTYSWTTLKTEITTNTSAWKIVDVVE